MVCKRKEVSMKENKSDVTDAVQHWIAVVVVVCAILSGCGRNESAEFEITPPREWDEGISRSRYVVSEDTGKTVLVADNSLLRDERLPTIKEARELIENADAVGICAGGVRAYRWEGVDRFPAVGGGADPAGSRKIRHLRSDSVPKRRGCAGWREYHQL